MKNSFRNLIFLAILAAVFFPAVTLAQDTGQTTNPPPGDTGQTTNKPKTMTLQNPLGNVTLAGFISNAIDIFSYIAIIFAALALIWVGFKFVIARGNVEQMKEARNWLGYIVVGVAIIIGARVILSVIISTLSASGAVNKNVINSTQNVLNNQ